MEILSQFLLRLTFGLAVGMAITSPQKVFSGFYRNHLYVTLGLTTLAALVLWPLYGGAAAFAAIAAACSFIGAALWLYDARRAGIFSIWAVAWSSFLAAFLGAMIVKESIAVPNMMGGSRDIVLVHLNTLNGFRIASIVTSGLVLGVTFAAMAAPTPSGRSCRALRGRGWTCRAAARPRTSPTRQWWRRSSVRIVAPAPG
jgi:hypothetical protein